MSSFECSFMSGSIRLGWHEQWWQTWKNMQTFKSFCQRFHLYYPEKGWLKKNISNLDCANLLCFSGSANWSWTLQKITMNLKYLLIIWSFKYSFSFRDSRSAIWMDTRPSTWGGYSQICSVTVSSISELIVMSELVYMVLESVTFHSIQEAKSNFKKPII